MTKKVLLTGDRPTGNLHLGHYVGSLKQRVEMQEVYDTYIMIADTQALTDNFANPTKVRENILEVYRDYAAAGLDLSRVKVFIQSQIPELAELAMYLMNLATHAEVLRNPTVKTEIEAKQFGDSVPFGFVAYPISQAADILFCKANVVPVGEDQAPMIELTRKLAKKFNKTYNTDTFPLPQIRIGDVARLPGTDGNAKMGKSLGNAIYLKDTAEEVEAKVRKMYTDPNRKRATDPGTVEGNPVFAYHDAFNPNLDEVADLKHRYQKGTVGDVEVKQKLTLALNNFLDPIRDRRIQIEQKSDSELIQDLLTSTAQVREVAQATMCEVRAAMQLDYTLMLSVRKKY